MLGLARPWEGPGPSPMDPGSETYEETVERYREIVFGPTVIEDTWGAPEIQPFPTPSQERGLPHSGPPMTSPVYAPPSPPPTVFVPRVDPVVKWAAVGVGAIVLFFFIRGVTA